MSTVQPPQPSPRGSLKYEMALALSLTAAVLLAMVAAFEILQGIAAVTDEELFAAEVNYTLDLDVTVWGWIHIGLGVVGMAIALAILNGHTLGYLGGIALAFMVALVNFAYLPHYPVWAIVLIGGNVLVIWALCFRLSLDRVDVV
jgi:hypothetical protein